MSYQTRGDLIGKPLHVTLYSYGDICQVYVLGYIVLFPQPMSNYLGLCLTLGFIHKSKRIGTSVSRFGGLGYMVYWQIYPISGIPKLRLFYLKNLKPIKM